MRGKRTYGGRPEQRVEEQGTWASQKHSEAGHGRPVDRGVWTARTVKRPRQQPAHPQYTNYWAPLMRKRHTMPHSAQPQHTNYWALRTRKRHRQEHRLTESSDPTQHAKGRTGDCPGPRKGATTRRNVTQGDVLVPVVLRLWQTFAFALTHIRVQLHPSSFGLRCTHTGCSATGVKSWQFLSPARFYWSMRVLWDSMVPTHSHLHPHLYAHLGMPCTQCAQSAKFCMSANTRTLVLAPWGST